MFFRKCPVPELEQPPQETTSSGEELAGVEAAEGKLSRHTIRRLTAAFALAAMLVASVGTQVALASDTSGSGTASVIDMGIADQLIGLIKAANTFFTLSPINIFVMGSLIAFGFTIFNKAKNVAKK